MSGNLASAVWMVYIFKCRKAHCIRTSFFILNGTVLNPTKGRGESNVRMFQMKYLPFMYIHLLSVTDPNLNITCLEKLSVA